MTFTFVQVFSSMFGREKQALRDSVPPCDPLKGQVHSVPHLQAATQGGANPYRANLTPRSERAGIARYMLLRPVGAGGSATVFEALDRTTQARIAVKMLRRREGTALYHFKQEFRVLADLWHPNVVRFGEMFEDQGSFYLTMELIEGEDFLEWVRPGSRYARAPGLSETQTMTRGSAAGLVSDAAPVTAETAAQSPNAGLLDVARLRDALRQLCSGLTALHSAGLVHRDLKPGNILVTREGRLVLLDFGMAIELQRIPNTEFVGTVRYMAPEQLSGDPVSAAADWYTVGVILYEALTGRLPYEDEGAYDPSCRRERPPDPPERWAADLPPDLSQLCLQLLAVDPERRAGAAEVATRLGLDSEVERGRASFRSRLQYLRALFIGRRAELGRLHELQQRTRSGRGVVVQISGESGVGKSALARHFLDELAQTTPEVEILRGRCYERESVPYSGIDRVVDDLSRKLTERQRADDRTLFVPRRVSLLSQVFPVLRTLDAFNRSPARLTELDPFEARRLAFGALRELLASIADEQPLVVHIDDTQWLDAESLDLLQVLVTGSEAPRMLLLLTQRSNVVALATKSDPQTRVDPEFIHMQLGPLTASDSEQLATELMNRLGGARSEPALIALHAGGHPLFIHELVMHGAGHAEPWAPSLEGAVAARLAGLNASARRVLELVALAASPLSHAVAQAASGLRSEVYPWALFTLRSENLVTYMSLASHADVQPYHDRIREVVSAQIGDSARAHVHELLARAIERHKPADWDSLAHHFMHAGAHETAARYARLGAERALRSLAFAQAARLFRVALQVERKPALCAELEEGLGRALANAGHGVDAAEAFLRAAANSTGPRALDLKRRGGEQLLRSGRVERGFLVLTELAQTLHLCMPRWNTEYMLSVLRALARIEVDKVLTQNRTPTDGDELLRLELCWTFAAGLSLVNIALAIHFLARATALSLSHPDTGMAVRSVSTLAAVLCQMDATRAVGRRALAWGRELARLAPSPENDAWIALDSGIAAMGDGDFATCEVTCSAAQAAFRDHCTGVAWEVVTSQAFELWAMIFQGKIAALSERLPTSIVEARSRDDRFALATLTLGPLHLVGLALDEPDRVRAECDESMRDWTSELCVFQRACALYVEAHVDLYQGEPEQGWARLTDHWPELETSLTLTVRIHRIEFLGLRARLALGCAVTDRRHRARWLARARADEKSLAREGLGFAHGLAASAEACRVNLLRASHSTRTLACLNRAHQAFTAQGMGLHAEIMLLGHAVLARNPEHQANAEASLRARGVVNLPKMQRLWLPGLPVA